MKCQNFCEPNFNETACLKCREINDINCRRKTKMSTKSQTAISFTFFANEFLKQREENKILDQ